MYPFCCAPPESIWSYRALTVVCKVVLRDSVSRKNPEGWRILRFVTGEAKSKTSETYFRFATSHDNTLPHACPDKKVMPSYVVAMQFVDPMSAIGESHRSDSFNCREILCAFGSCRGLPNEGAEKKSTDCNVPSSYPTSNALSAGSSVKHRGVAGSRIVRSSVPVRYSQTRALLSREAEMAILHLCLLWPTAMHVTGARWFDRVWSGARAEVPPRSLDCRRWNDRIFGNDHT